MSGKYILAVSSLLVILLSCSSKQSNTILLSQIDSSIVLANQHTVAINANILETFKQRNEDPRTQMKAEIWQPTVTHIQTICAKANLYIDSLRKVLFENEGGNEAVHKLFIEKAEGEKLFNRLKQYKNDLLNSHEKLRKEFKPYLFIIYRNEDSLKNSQKFSEQYFSSATTEEVITFLSSLQTNVLIAENKCLSFCLEQIPYHESIYDQFEALVGQNAKILKAGDDLEITAGLGAFSRTKRPEIKVGSDYIPLNEKGLAIYKFKTSNKSGNYSMPVIIEYLDRDGKQQSIRFEVEYTLLDALKK